MKTSYTARPAELVWLFWLAHLIGAILAGLIYPALSGEARLVAPGRLAEGVPA